MSAVETLKEQARTHEQKEEWSKALDLYRKAIQKLEKEDQSDIGLYNRVADIQVRQGQIEAAVLNYEKAIDLYVDAELPNNAIAVCKKIVRNMPSRHSVYLRMGQIRGRQGLVAESRQNFLTYAERMQVEGNVDEGLKALTELADLSPDDPAIRLMIAAQLQTHGRKEEAITQLQTGFRQASERGAATDQYERMLRQLGAEPGQLPVAAPDTDLGGFGEIVLAPPTPAPEEPAGLELGGFEIAPRAPEGQAEAEAEAEEEAPLPMFDFTAPGDEAEDEEEEEEEGEPLPMFAPEEEGDETEEPLPLIGDGYATAAPDPETLDAAAFGESDRGGQGEYVAGADELPPLELDVSVEPPGAGAAREAAMEEERRRPSAPRPAAAPPPKRPAGAPPLPQPAPRPAAPPATAGAPAKGVSAPDPMGHEMLAAHGDWSAAITSLRKLTKLSPDDLTLANRLVDYANELGDPEAIVGARLDLADALKRAGQAAKAHMLYQQVLGVEPRNPRALAALGKGPAAPAKAAPKAAPAEGFVDLGSMVLDDEDEAEKTTRFVVAYEEPTGDEQADFAKMLSQFKAKVAENLSADDVKAHLDLGTAYKEMGLLEEAIAEFQQALRASSDHLPTYEMLGQCFMEKGEPEAAVRTLKRALDAPFEVEDELLGIYYYLGRAHEQLGNTKDALEFYDRVFTLDINFADVTERLRALR